MKNEGVGVIPWELGTDPSHLQVREWTALSVYQGKSEMERDSFVDCLAEAIAEKIGRLSGKKRLFSLEEAAEYYGMSEESIRELMVRGVIKPKRLTRRVQFDIRELDRAIDEAK